MLHPLYLSLLVPAACAGFFALGRFPRLRQLWLLVCSGVILGAIGVYQPFADWAGAGATVPLLGFGNLLWKGVQKAIGEDGFLGIFKGGLTSAAGGITAALVFSYLAALIFEPKMKK